ncbi:hypothetical protein MCOR25_005795 [Pyricularia grisea]|uniref:DUF3602 domain-containing protein n=1 Tax=Pyricularia grisea TaxID=148305 RepID=A0A6P8BH30_PYRGI|nr:uncharacterized protein PgNI_01593 [Pyricularia grisea]KAI6363729.1 hypothetical protein MCOR25_005795 [Pyricularia grisea]TLD15957.1 hypothetical protein PgNI_01593 [Pyricularia grisea]
MPSYTINEPHPTVQQNTYTHSGRGGAGNTFLVSQPTTSPEGIPTKASVKSSSSSSSRFFSGRGGAGNAHASQRPAMSFDDEYYADAVRASSERVYVGRGGAGNYCKKNEDVHSVKSRRDSSSTSGSERSGFWGRLSSNSRR